MPQDPMPLKKTHESKQSMDLIVSCKSKHIALETSENHSNASIFHCFIYLHTAAVPNLDVLEI